MVAFFIAHKKMSKNNPYRNCSFFTSVNHYQDLPEDNVIEVAFAGRSNAGKSSAINILTDNKNLCKTSKTPGRTQLINYFQLQNEEYSHRYIVDLPGYGYAKVPVEVKNHWQNLLERYLAERQSLKGLVMIMDIRRPMTEYDRIMMDWCKVSDMPCHVLLTKMDKLKSGAAKNALQKFKQQCRNDYPKVSAQMFSSLKKYGNDQLIEKLNLWYHPD